MPRDGFPEEKLVFSFDSGHVQQVLDTIVHSYIACIVGRFLVFQNVSTFEPPGKVHRKKPARNEAKWSKHPPDQPEQPFSLRPRARAKRCKPRPDPFAMVPFLRLDLLYSFFFRARLERTPMASIGQGRRGLARVGILQDTNEFEFVGLQCGLSDGLDPWRPRAMIHRVE